MMQRLCSVEEGKGEGGRRTPCEESLFYRTFSPLSQVASKFVGQVEISYLHRSVKIHGPLVLNYYLQKLLLNYCGKLMYISYYFTKDVKSAIAPYC